MSGQQSNRIIEAEDAGLDVMIHELKQPLLCLSVIGERLMQRAQILRAEAHPRADGIACDADILATAVAQIQEIMMAYSTTARLQVVESEWLQRFKRIVGSIETIATSKGVNFMFDCRIQEREAGPDLSALGQIMHNLATNAVLALDAAGIQEKKVHLSALIDADHLVLEIHDSGPGVPEHLMARVFERGFSTRLGHGGSGYGLWVCRKVVEALDGSIVVTRSSDLHGAKFAVRIPMTMAVASVAA